MPLGGQDPLICFPGIGVDHSALAIDGRQRVPKHLSTLSASIADVNPNDFSGVGIEGESDPLFVSLVVHKRPEFIALHPQWLFFLSQPQPGCSFGSIWR